MWHSRALELYQAAADLPWLQRKIIFNTNEPDAFLQSGLVNDPITELYVRARYSRPAAEMLFDAAIKAAIDEVDLLAGVNRLGLVAWCLGRYKAFDHLAKIPSVFEINGLPIE
ncbi:hypothetical protein DXH78_17885 [Undibacter mobilis]|uniref:Uncharacterized protein n=2 Tax=Undibacter mobilis TaxID=2292256 RepID=A0A371B0I7_9BRAD|nr:hypothetical protein DXH78_17885 [Undibacter mobilis]